MVVLGLDPGFSSMGWALLNLSGAQPYCLDAGVIRTKPDNTLKRCDDNVRRCNELITVLWKLHRETDFDLIAAESQSWTSFHKADRALAMAWGAISAFAYMNHIHITQFRPQEIKKALCGQQSASKSSVDQALCRECAGAERALGGLLKSQRNHAADALGAAWTSMDHGSTKLMQKIRDKTLEKIKS